MDFHLKSYLRRCRHQLHQQYDRYPYRLCQLLERQLEAELEEYKLVRRPEVVERIKVARSYGDLSENSEYEAAKDEQAFVEGQIQILETKIRYAEIVDSDAVANDEVAIGKTVVVQQVPEEQRKQMAVTMYSMPIMMIVFGISSPAAVILYWFVGGIFSRGNVVYDEHLSITLLCYDFIK